MKRKLRVLGLRLSATPQAEYTEAYFRPFFYENIRPFCLFFRNQLTSGGVKDYTGLMFCVRISSPISSFPMADVDLTPFGYRNDLTLR